AVRAVGVAEEQETPFPLEIGFAERLAVLVDQVERPADRAGEQRSGSALRVLLPGENQERAGRDDQQPSERGRQQRIARQAFRLLGGGCHCFRLRQRPAGIGMPPSAAFSGPIAPALSTTTLISR